MGEATYAEGGLSRRQYGRGPGTRSERQRYARQTGMDSQLKWLLLRHAVDCPQAPDEISAVDTNDLALRENACKDVKSAAIVRIVEGGNQHQAIGDVKISITGGQTLSTEDDRAGKRQFDDLQLASMRVSGGAQPAQVFPQRFVVGVATVRFDRCEHGIG